MTHPQSDPSVAARAPFAAMLRGALIPSVALAVVTTAVIWAVSGSRAGLAALLAVSVTVAFFAGGLHVMTRVVNSSPISLLTGALAVYMGQILVLAVVIFGLSGASWLDGPAFGIAALVIALGWQVFQVLAFVRQRRSVYDEPHVDARRAGE